MPITAKEVTQVLSNLDSQLDASEGGRFRAVAAVGVDGNAIPAFKSAGKNFIESKSEKNRELVDGITTAIQTCAEFVNEANRNPLRVDEVAGTVKLFSAVVDAVQAHPFLMQQDNQNKIAAACSNAGQVIIEHRKQMSFHVTMELDDMLTEHSASPADNVSKASESSAATNSVSRSDSETSVNSALSASSSANSLSSTNAAPQAAMPEITDGTATVFFEGRAQARSEFYDNNDLVMPEITDGTATVFFEGQAQPRSEFYDNNELAMPEIDDGTATTYIDGKAQRSSTPMSNINDDDDGPLPAMHSMNEFNPGDQQSSQSARAQVGNYAEKAHRRAFDTIRTKLDAEYEAKQAQPEAGVASTFSRK